MVEMDEPAPRITELERILTLVTYPVAAAVVSEPKTGPLTTPMPIQAYATTSQDIATTLTTARTLLLLTSGSLFDKTTTPACFDLPSHQ